MKKGRLLTNTLYLSCALLSFLAAPALASTITWKAAVGGSWSIASNWLPAQVPGANDVAVITAAGTYDVNINGNVSVNAINLGSNARLKVNSVTLTTTTGIAVGASSTLELNSATLNGGGISLNGQLSSSGTSNVNVALSTASSSTITVGAGSLVVANGFTNLGLLSFPATGLRYFFVTDGTFTNAPAGIVSCATNGSLIANLDNQGSITATGAQGFLTLGKSGGTSTNSGPISATGGAYVVLNGFGDTMSTSGNLTADAQSTVRVGGGVFHHTGGTISGGGYFELVGTTSATFVSNPTTAFLYLGGSGISFPSALVNGAAQIIILGVDADVTAPQLTNQVGYTLQLNEGSTLHVVFFFNLGTIYVPRSFVLDGNLNCGPLSNLAFEIGGTNPGDFDQFEVTGAAQLGGGIFLYLVNGFFPAPGDHFDILTSPAHFGLFQMNGWELGNDVCLITDPGVTSSESHPYTIRAIRQKWTQINPVSGFAPVARRGASAVYMPLHNEMIIFGGEASDGHMLNDVWMLENPDGKAGLNTFWHPIPTTGTPPAPRKGHTAVYDTFNHRMIVFGGENDSSTFFSDIWILDEPDGATRPATWMQFPSLPGVAPRSGHGAAYNPTSNRMIMSQGNAYCDPSVGEMWTLDHANGLGTSTGWTLWSIFGTPPSSRRDAIYAYDVNGNRLLVYGGRTPCGAAKTDAFVLSNADGTPEVYTAWSSLGADAEPALPGLYGAPGGYDPLFDRLVTFGGIKADGTTLSSSVLLLANTQGNAGWSELPAPTMRPAARAFHSMVYRPDGKTWIVFGGDANGQYMNDVWTLELEGDAPQVSGVGPVSPQKQRVLAFGASPNPNPCSHGMQFSVKAMENTNARIAIYDVLGRQVIELQNGPITAGEHRFQWKGNVAAGMYFVAVRSGSTEDVRRIVVTR